MASSKISEKANEIHVEMLKTVKGLKDEYEEKSYEVNLLKSRYEANLEKLREFEEEASHLGIILERKQ